jgi:hypothetical protein
MLCEGPDISLSKAGQAFDSTSDCCEEVQILVRKRVTQNEASFQKISSVIMAYLKFVGMPRGVSKICLPETLTTTSYSCGEVLPMIQDVICLPKAEGGGGSTSGSCGEKATFKIPLTTKCKYEDLVELVTEKVNATIHPIKKRKESIDRIRNVIEGSVDKGDQGHLYALQELAGLLMAYKFTDEAYALYCDLYDCTCSSKWDKSTVEDEKWFVHDILISILHFLHSQRYARLFTGNPMDAENVNLIVQYLVDEFDSEEAEDYRLLN